VAVGFLAIMGLALVLVTMTVNVGQMAKVRAEVSNAADAGALAGASWMASGMNEAALVAGKIGEAVSMVQAILTTVPFCPGDDQAQYAEALWASLVAHPYADDPYSTPPPLVCPPGGGLCVPGGGPGSPFGNRRGPAPYFAEVANDAMWAAWYMANREWYTAAVNNLMINSDTGPSTLCSSENWWECLGGYSNYNPVSDKIIEYQKRQIESPISVAPGTLKWNNNLDFEDPLDLQHSAPMNVEMPEQPPQLVLDPFEGAYYMQFTREDFIPVDGAPDPVFSCTFEGWGIMTGYSGTADRDPDTQFVMMPTSLLDYSINPLRMAIGSRNLGGGVLADYWRKNWDIDWLEGPPSSLEDLSGVDPYVPSLDHLTLDTCRVAEGSAEVQHVCNIVIKPLPELPLSPRFVMNGDMTVEVKVAHKVETASGSIETVFADLPILEPRFEAVGASARARVIPPQFTFPMYEARVVMEDVK